MALERTILFITGANKGLGYEAVRALAASSVAYEILLGSRSADKGQQAVENAIKEFPAVKGRISTIPIDIESDESIQASFDTIKSKYGRLDVLINNAGAAFDQYITSGKMTMREAWNHSWNVNTTGAQVMTATFVPLLLQSKNPRLLFIASGTSSFAVAEVDNLPFNRAPASGWPKTDLVPQNNVAAYRSSKAGLNMMMKEWHRMLRNDGVKVFGISPGYLATGLGGSQETNQKQGAGNPALGGQFIKDVVEGQRDADVGKAILRDKVQPW